ncbi:DUF1801 domain-containing protein [Patescibacteria group bacterium]
MQSKAKTVKEYLTSLTNDRSTAIKKVRQAILKNLPKGYKEGMQYGMITYYVPLSLFPAGYLGKKDVPLPYVSLSSQKNHMAVYLLNVYSDKKLYRWFVNQYKKTGKKIDIGKSCVRFRKIEDLPVELIGQAVAKTSVAKYIQDYQSAKRK